MAYSVTSNNDSDVGSNDGAIRAATISNLKKTLNTYRETQPINGQYKTTAGYFVGCISGYSKKAKLAAIEQFEQYLAQFENTSPEPVDAASDEPIEPIEPIVPFKLDLHTLKVLQNGALGIVLSEFKAINNDAIQTTWWPRELAIRPEHRRLVPTGQTSCLPAQQPQGCLSSIARFFCCLPPLSHASVATAEPTNT